MPLKIEVGRLMSPEEMVERIKREKADFDTAVEKRKAQCESLGLIGQLDSYNYRPNPENFYRQLSEKETVLITYRHSNEWCDIRDFRKGEIPNEVLEELAIVRDNDIFSIPMLCMVELKGRNDFVLFKKGINGVPKFLVVHWGDGPNTLAAIEASFQAEEETAEKERKAKKEEEQRKLERNLILDIPIPPMIRDRIIVFQYSCPCSIFRVIGKTTIVGVVIVI